MIWTKKKQGFFLVVVPLRGVAGVNGTMTSKHLEVLVHGILHHMQMVLKSEEGKY